MSEQPQKSQHAEILNALDEMQASVAYAARRHHLAQAEQCIVWQEQRIAQLEAEVVQLKEEIDGWELGSRGFP